MDEDGFIKISFSTPIRQAIGEDIRVSLHSAYVPSLLWEVDDSSDTSTFVYADSDDSSDSYESSEARTPLGSPSPQPGDDETVHAAEVNLMMDGLQESRVSGLLKPFLCEFVAEKDTDTYIETTPYTTWVPIKERSTERLSATLWIEDTSASGKRYKASQAGAIFTFVIRWQKGYQDQSAIWDPRI